MGSLQKDGRAHEAIVKPSGRVEITIENNEHYSGKMIVANDKWSSDGQWHYHPKKDETFYVVHGVLALEIGQQMERGVDVKKYTLEDGESFRIRPGTYHRFKAHTSEAILIEFATHDDPTDSVRVPYSPRRTLS